MKTDSRSSAGRLCSVVIFWSLSSSTHLCLMCFVNIICCVVSVVGKNQLLRRKVTSTSIIAAQADTISSSQLLVSTGHTATPAMMSTCCFSTSQSFLFGYFPCHDNILLSLNFLCFDMILTLYNSW